MPFSSALQRAGLNWLWRGVCHDFVILLVLPFFLCDFNETFTTCKVILFTKNNPEIFA